MGSTNQLGQGDNEDDAFEPIVISGKQLANKFVYFLCIFIIIIFTIKLPHRGGLQFVLALWLTERQMHIHSVYHSFVGIAIELNE